jgi:hypothetical protein
MVEKYSRSTKGGTTDSTSFWTRKTFTKSYDDLTVTISKKYHRRPDLMANDIYGTSEVMWFILQYNDIVDVYDEFIEGVVLTIPSPMRFTEGMI